MQQGIVAQTRKIDAENVIEKKLDFSNASLRDYDIENRFKDIQTYYQRLQEVGLSVPRSSFLLDGGIVTIRSEFISGRDGFSALTQPDEASGMRAVKLLTSEALKLVRSMNGPKGVGSQRAPEGSKKAYTKVCITEGGQVSFDASQSDQVITGHYRLDQ